MKILIIILTLVSSLRAFACLPFPGNDTKLKNDLVLAVSNQYYADVLNSEIKLQNYKHSYEWKFTDAGFMCHDTDIISDDVRSLGRI